MQVDTDSDQTPDREAAPPRAADARRAYVEPALEYLGRWSALTLQQSVGIALFQALLNEAEW